MSNRGSIYSYLIVLILGTIVFNETGTSSIFSHRIPTTKRK